MPERTYKLSELVGVSENTMEEAIRNALARASQTLKGMDWFEVTEVRGVWSLSRSASVRAGAQKFLVVMCM